MGAHNLPFPNCLCQLECNLLIPPLVSYRESANSRKSPKNLLRLIWFFLELLQRNVNFIDLLPNTAQSEILPKFGDRVLDFR